MKDTTFEEEFPSLCPTDRPRIRFEPLYRDLITEHCLDKQRLKKELDMAQLDYSKGVDANYLFNELRSIFGLGED